MMKRRDFLALGAAALSAPAIAGRASAQAGTLLDQKTLTVHRPRRTWLLRFPVCDQRSARIGRALACRDRRLQSCDRLRRGDEHVFVAAGIARGDQLNGNALLEIAQALLQAQRAQCAVRFR